MGLPEILAVVLVVTVCVTLFAGYPVALTLGGVSLLFAGLGHALGAMNAGLLGALPQRIFGVMTNDVLIAIPLFIFMGVMLERSRIAEELLSSVSQLFGSRSGGLGVAAGEAFTSVTYPELAGITKYGGLGVDLFFMISGFVILMTAGKKIGGNHPGDCHHPSRRTCRSSASKWSRAAEEGSWSDRCWLRKPRHRTAPRQRLLDRLWSHVAGRSDAARKRE